MHKLKIHTTDVIQVLQISDVQMDASTEGHVATHGHPGTTIQMDTEAEGPAKEPDLCVLFAMDVSTDGPVVAHGQYQDFIFCLLWMPEQMDLLLHTDTTRTSCLFTVDASTEGLVVAHGHYCYVICTTLVVEAAVKTIN